MVTTSITDLNAGSEVTLGLGSYQMSRDSLLLLAPEIALQAARKLNFRLTAAEEQKIRISATDSLKARELFVKSEYYLNRLLQMDTAIELLSQAIAIDPNFAEAYAQRAKYRIATTSWHGNRHIGEMRNKIAEDIDKALALNEELAEAYNARATANMLIDWDFKKAEQNFQRAEALSPTNRPVDSEYPWYLGMVRGEMEKGFELMEKVYQSDPMSISKQMDYSWALFMVGRKEEAYEVVRRMAQQAPEAPFSYVDFFFFYVDGNYQKALELSRKYDSFFLPERVPYSLYYEGFIYAKTGDPEKALQVAEKLDEYKLAGAIFSLGLRLAQSRHLRLSGR